MQQRRLCHMCRAAAADCLSVCLSLLLLKLSQRSAVGATAETSATAAGGSFLRHVANAPYFFSACHIMLRSAGKNAAQRQFVMRLIRLIKLGFGQGQHCGSHSTVGNNVHIIGELAHCAGQGRAELDCAYEQLLLRVVASAAARTALSAPLHCPSSLHLCPAALVCFSFSLPLSL